MIILKWTVPVDDKRHIIGGGSVVHVASQRGKIDEVQVWTVELDIPEERMPARTVVVVGTGQVLPQFANPIGSVVVAGGDLVWHVVEIK